MIWPFWRYMVILSSRLHPGLIWMCVCVCGGSLPGSILSMICAQFGLLAGTNQFSWAHEPREILSGNKRLSFHISCCPNWQGHLALPIYRRYFCCCRWRLKDSSLGLRCWDSLAWLPQPLFHLCSVPVRCANGKGEVAALLAKINSEAPLQINLN